MWRSIPAALAYPGGDVLGCLCRPSILSYDLGAGRRFWREFHLLIIVRKAKHYGPFVIELYAFKSPFGFEGCNSKHFKVQCCCVSCDLLGPFMLRLLKRLTTDGWYYDIKNLCTRCTCFIDRGVVRVLCIKPLLQLAMLNGIRVMPVNP